MTYADALDEVARLTKLSQRQRATINRLRDGLAAITPTCTYRRWWSHSFDWIG